MKLPEIEVPYVPAADEPSPFMDHPHGFPTVWGEWYKGTVIYPTHRTWIDEKYPDRKGTLSNAIPVFGIDELVQRGWKGTLKAIEETLTASESSPAPEESPAIFVEGTRVITLAWIMDRCLRNKVSPYDAMKAGNTIKSVTGKTLSRQEVYLANFDQWLLLDGDIRVRMVTDKEQNTFSDFRIIMGYLSRTISFHRLVGENGRIAQTEATVWILDGEALGNFTNEANFSENDLRRLIAIFQISIGLLPDARTR